MFISSLFVFFINSGFVSNTTRDIVQSMYCVCCLCLQFRLRRVVSECCDVVLHRQFCQVITFAITAGSGLDWCEHY